MTHKEESPIAGCLLIFVVSVLIGGGLWSGVTLVGKVVGWNFTDTSSIKGEAMQFEVMLKIIDPGTLHQRVVVVDGFESRTNNFGHLIILNENKQLVAMFNEWVMCKPVYDDRIVIPDEGAAIEFGNSKLLEAAEENQQ